MKKILSVAALALALVSVANISQAQNKKVATAFCVVNPTGEKVLGSQFFSTIVRISQQSPGVCVVGKIAYEAGSGRVYLNGRRLAKYAGSLTNAEVKMVELENFCRAITYSCEQTNNPF